MLIFIGSPRTAATRFKKSRLVKIPASAPPDITSTQSCALNSTCAINLYEELGGLPDAQLKYLAVLITLVPSSDNQGPSITNWDITYSCPFNQ